MKPEPGLRTGKTHNMRLAYRESCLEKKIQASRASITPRGEKKYCFASAGVLSLILFSLLPAVYILPQ
jgi:hypothetical protein